MRIVCISDTHGRHDEILVPEGDVLIHAGDITSHGELADVVRFDRWFASHPHRHKILIAGNHDFAFERNPGAARARITSAIYLQDESVKVCGLLFYGSPWQPWFYDWAFNLKRGPELSAKWALIPEGVDILITHGPPVGHGDRTIRGNRTGCADLLERLQAIRPRLHVFGHIHEGYGQTREGKTLCINASVLDVGYEPRNPPVVVDLQ